jgi:hypothetical protein
MEIKTKFDINDSCWIMSSNKPTVYYISGIRVELSEDDGNITTTIVYTIERKSTYNQGERDCKEDELFSTKEELIKTL